MKKLFILLAISTSANALQPGDYGYGYQYHGYNSLQQQQDIQRDLALMQQTEQTQLAIQLRNRLNSGEDMQPSTEIDTVIDLSE
jgi:hypothetical protein